MNVFVFGGLSGDWSGMGVNWGVNQLTKKFLIFQQEEFFNLACFKAYKLICLMHILHRTNVNVYAPKKYLICDEKINSFCQLILMTL